MRTCTLGVTTILDTLGGLALFGAILLQGFAVRKNILASCQMATIRFLVIREKSIAGYGLSRASINFTAAYRAASDAVILGMLYRRGKNLRV